MKRWARILTVAAAALSVRAGGSGHMEALRLAVGTNGAEAAKAALAGIDWQGVRDPVAEIGALKGMVEGREGFEGVARELKTKLRLLTPGAKMDGSDGTLPVPVAEAPVVETGGVGLPQVATDPVPLAYLRAVRVVAGGGTFRSVGLPVAGGVAVCLPVAGVRGLDMPVTDVGSGISGGMEETYGAFVAERDVWAERYRKYRRFRNGDGTLLEPDHGTALHRMRLEIESGVERYDALIDAYNARMERALWRRKMLREVR